jgi:serine/threonine protein kinase
VPMEAYVLRNVKHSGVVSFIDLFEDSTYFYLVTYFDYIELKT